MRSIRVVILGLWFLGQLVTWARPPAGRSAPEGKNSIRREQDIVIINVPIDLFVSPDRRFIVAGQRGATAEELAASWERQAEAIWNEGLGDHRFRGCYQIQVDIRFGVITSRDQVREGTHWVRLRRSGYRSNVNHGGGKGEDSGGPYTSSRKGQWGIVPSDTVAHEVGHFLGLGDDYVDVYDEEGNRTGFRENSGREGTIMANYRSNPKGRIDQEIVDRLGDLLEEHEELPPCIEGFWEESIDRQHSAGHTSTGEVFFFIELEPNDAGELEGTATGTFELVGRLERGGCQFDYSTGVDIEFELEVSGSGDGPYTIQSSETRNVHEVQRHYLCDQPFDVTIDWDIGLSFEDVVFEEGHWETEEEKVRVVLTYTDPNE